MNAATKEGHAWAKIRVLKLGGSLLDLPDLPDRVRRWQRAFPGTLDLWVVGGGQMVDSVRNLDRIHAFNASFIHWLCIELLEHTGKLVHRLLPEFSWVPTAGELERLCSQHHDRHSAIVAVPAFYGPETKCQVVTPQGNTSNLSELPETWETTSDSLAALLAVSVGARECILFKSSSPPEHCRTPSQWAEAGMVDPAFPALVSAIDEVALVNLRTWAPSVASENTTARQ